MRAMFDSMVVGTDGSETAQEAVRQASDLAKRLDAKVHLVSAYEPVPEGRLREERQQVPDDLQWMVNPREDVSATLEEAAKDLEEQGVKVETHAREGDPADAILDVAEEQGADLIVVGNKGMTGAKRFLLGSVPEQGLPSRSLQRDDHPDYLAGRQRGAAQGARGVHQAPAVAGVEPGLAEVARGRLDVGLHRARRGVVAELVGGDDQRRDARPRGGWPSRCPRSRPAARTGARCCR